MRMHKRLLGLAALMLAGITCSFPSDESNQVFVTISSIDTSFVVRRGESLELYARMWRRMGADSAEIQNARFSWTTDNPTLATVQAGGLGSATVTGVNSGIVNVNARSAAFESSQRAQFGVRVAERVEVDSVRPTLVRWGDKITVFGVGVDSLILTFLDNVTLFDYPIPGILGTRTRDSLGFSTAVFWVPPPAHTDSVSYIGPGVFGSGRDTIRVLPFDIYEPNEIAPWLLDLDAPPIVPAVPQIRFFNPAVAFEQTKRDEQGADWYRFHQTTPRDLTIIINSSEARGTFRTFLSDSLFFDASGPSPTYRIGLDAWTIGPSLYACHGFAFEPVQLQPDSTIVALRRAPVPQDTLDALSIYSEAGRYGLTVLEGYVVSNPAFPRDDHEEDDFCNAADAPPHPSANPGFRDTLTIDNPFEVDWVRFRVTALSTVQFRVASLVAGDTLSDVDLYVLDDTTGGLAQLGTGQRIGSDENFTVALTVGEYYAVVVDYAGVPTRYSLCIGATACALGFPAPPATSAAQSLQRKAPPPAPVRAPRATRVRQ